MTCFGDVILEWRFEFRIHLRRVLEIKLEPGCEDVHIYVWGVWTLSCH